MMMIVTLVVGIIVRAIVFFRVLGLLKSIVGLRLGFGQIKSVLWGLLYLYIYCAVMHRKYVPKSALRCSYSCWV